MSFASSRMIMMTIDRSAGASPAEKQNAGVAQTSLLRFAAVGAGVPPAEAGKGRRL